MERGRVVLFVILIAGFSAVGRVGSEELPFVVRPALEGSFDGASCVDVGDIDQDGDLDVVATAAWDAEIAWFENDGSGAFTKHGITTDLDEIWTVALGDIDGDSDLDIVAGSNDYGDIAEVCWYENPTVGSNTTWTQNTVISMAIEGVNSLALASISRYGKVEIVLSADGAGGATTLMWLGHNGSGSSWIDHTIDVLSSGDRAYGVATADVDGDGDTDVVATLYGTGDILWWEHDGAPTPADHWTAHTIDSTMGGAIAVAAGDLDGDGDVDVAGVGHTADRLSWYERSGATWTEHLVLGSWNGAQSVRVVDMDHDGDLDLLASAYYADDVTWFENVAGDASSWIQRVVAGTFNGARSAAAGDFDGDGDYDVVAAGDLADVIDWWRNDGCHRTNGMEYWQTIRDQMMGADAVAIGDINRDGLMDIVGSAYDGNSITALLGAFPHLNSWWQNDVTTGLNGVEDVALADIDRDGDLDIVAAASGANTVTWWRNSGGVVPSWTGYTLLSGFDAWAVAPGDVDGDGYVDVVVGGYSDNTVLWLKNQGAVTGWPRHDVRTNVNGVYDVDVGDLNNDGFLDIVASANSANKVVALLNVTGAGLAWWEEDVVTSFFGAKGIDIVDINADGAEDVFATSSVDDEVVWIENSGDGMAWTSHVINTGSIDMPITVKGADMDADGDVDVMAAGSGGDFMWWNNQGASGGWDFLWAAWTSAYGPRDLAIGDLDSDGYPDVAMAIDGGAGDGSDDMFVWWPNFGGQFTVSAGASVVDQMGNGESLEFFWLRAIHWGSAGDPPIELVSLDLLFEDGDGTPLTSQQANALFSKVEVFRDSDGDHAWSPADVEVTQVLTFSLTAGGEETMTFFDGDPEARLQPEQSREYLVVLTTTSDASAVGPLEFRLTFPESGVEAEDADHDIPMKRGGVLRDARTRIVDLIDPMFADGFESGSTSAWSSAVP